MTVTTTPAPVAPAARDTAAPDLGNPAYQAFWLMRIGFTIAPIVFGLDKFTNWLVDWDHYLAPQVTDAIHVQAHTVMLGVGVIEIVAGLVVLFAPKFGGYLVAAWLAGIIVNLLVIGGFADIALRDFGLLLAALALARLATAFPNGLPTTRART